ncbi:unnamed protein product [Closterium sp. NIES-53]
MYALTDSAEGDCYLSVSPDPGIEAAALGASASAAPGTGESDAPGAGESALSSTAPTEALHTFTLDSGASRSFFRDSTTLPPLSRPVAVSLADPSGGPVLSHSSTVLPCPAAPSGLLSGLHLPSFSTNLVSGADLQDAWVAASSQVFAAASRSSPASAPYSCCPLSHETLLWHHRLSHPSLPRLQGMASRTLVSGLPRSLPPLPLGPAPTCVPCVKGRQRAAPHSSTFPSTEAPLQTLHMDVWGPARVRGQGHERYFLLVVDDYSRYTTVFPLCSKGEVTKVLIDWIRGARRQLSERFGLDLPVLRLHPDRGGEFSSELMRAFCRAEGIRQTFTLPASPQKNGIAERRIGMIMDVARTSMIHAAAPHFLCIRSTFSLVSPCRRPHLLCSGRGSVLLQSLSLPHCLSPPPPPLFLAPGTPPVDPLPPQGPAPLGVSQVDPAEPVEIAVDSGASRGAEPGGAGTGGAEPGGAEPAGAGTERVEPGGAERERVESGAPGTPPVDPLPPQGPAPLGVSQVDPAEPVEIAVDSGASRGAEPGGAGTGGAEPGGAEPAGAGTERVEPGGAERERVESGGAEPERPLSPQRLREWYARHCRCATGSAGAGAAGGAAGAGAAGGAAGAGAAGGAVGAGAAGGAAGAGAAGGAAGAGAAGATGPGGARTGGSGASGAGGAVFAVSGGAVRPRPYYVPLLQQLQPASPLPGLSPYSGPTRGLTERRELESRPASPESRSASPVRTVRAGRSVLRPCPPSVPGTHSMTLRLSTAPQRVPLLSPPASSLPVGPDPEPDSLCATSPAVTHFLASVVTDPSFESTAASALVAELVDFAAACRLEYAASLVAESESVSVCPPSVVGECALGTDVLEDRQEEFQCFAASVPHLVSMLLAPEGDPDAPDIPTPRSYAEAIEGTYVGEVPPSGANIVSSMWIFTVKRPPGSPPIFKARYVARGFSQRQGRDYELHLLDFSTTFLQGSLHEEIWLPRPPGFSGSFPGGTQWSLRRPVYGLRQAPREWHDTLRTTLAALGFPPSTADPSLLLRTDTTLPPFYVLVYVDDLVFATADTEALAHVKSELQKRHTCTNLAPPSDESVEPSGPYPELVGCLMYLMTCTRPGLAYPLSLLARYVAPVHQAWGSCLEDGLELSSLVTQTLPGSSCEAEIYAGAMAAQELRWLTYLLTDLGEAPRSPPVLYVDNKAMLALCQEHRLEHRMKHIALRYFLARELQQRGQLRLAYVACFVLLTWPHRPTLLMSSSRHFSLVIISVSVLS